MSMLISDFSVPESQILQEVPYRTLWTWRTKGCCALGGKKLRSRLENGERLYSRSQWDHVKQAAARSPLDAVEINSRTYFSLQLAYQQYPSLARIHWRLCRWLK